MRYNFSLPLSSPPVKPFFRVVDLDRSSFVDPCTVADEDEGEYCKLKVNETGDLLLSDDGHPQVREFKNRRVVVVDTRRGIRSRFRRVYKVCRALLGLKSKDQDKESYVLTWSRIFVRDHRIQGEHSPESAPPGEGWTLAESFTRLDQTRLCPDGKTPERWYSGYNRWERDRPDEE
jgi:hypothetical protein